MSNGVTDVHRRPHYKAARPEGLLGDTLECKNMSSVNANTGSNLNIILNDFHFNA